MINGIGKSKRGYLHYREAGDNRGCAECEHYTNLHCKVMNGGVHYDMRCDAWNDREKENTWHVFVHAFKETVCVLVKEENTTIARKEFQLPVESIDKEVIDIHDAHTKALGCPDFVCNISPRKFKSIAFKNWLVYRGIQYRELDTEIDKMELKVDGDMTPLDVLSLLIDVVVVYPNEE